MANHKIEMYKPPRSNVKFDAERKQRFIADMEEQGLMTLAADAAGVAERTAHEHMLKDPDFAVAVKAAKRKHTERVIVQAMINRGVIGVEEDVFGGRFKDEVVGTKRVFSDSLLLALAKTRWAEMKDDGEGGGAGGVMFIPAAAPMTMDQWEEQLGEAAKGQTGREEGQ